MRTVSHREMRNQSGEILRAVAAGETVRVTNNGQVVADIVFPAADILVSLQAHGQLRQATEPLSALRAIKRRKAARPSAQILADARGRW